MLNIFSKYDKHARQPILGPTLVAIREKQPRGYPLGSPLKDEGSPIMTARSQPKQIFTLTATRVSQQPISGPTQTAMRKKQPTWLSLGEPPERRRLAH